MRVFARRLVANRTFPLYRQLRAVDPRRGVPQLGGAPKIDLMFTVCDKAAAEVCPVWPDRPVTAHWGVNDPAAVQGSDDDKRKAFARAFKELSSRIDQLLRA